MCYDVRPAEERQKVKVKARGKIYGVEAQRGRDTDPTVRRLGSICMVLVFSWGFNSRKCAEGRGAEELERVEKMCEVVLMCEKSWEDGDEGKNGRMGR